MSPPPKAITGTQHQELQAQITKLKSEVETCNKQFMDNSYWWLDQLNEQADQLHTLEREVEQLERRPWWKFKWRQPK